MMVTFIRVSFVIRHKTNVKPFEI